MSDGVFTNSTQASEGGGFYLESCPSVEMRRCRFEVLQAEEGGALFVRRGGVLSLDECVFERNGATLEGGAVLLDSTPFTITDCAFDSNFFTFDGRAPRSGGAVRSLASDGTVTGTSFRNERVSGKGGAWFQIGGAVEFESCVFLGNDAALFGGALDLELGGSITARRCLFSGNGARFGGSIAGSFTGAYEVDRCTFSGDSGRGAGAALYLDTRARARVVDSILCCAVQGDLVHCSGGEIALSHCDIWNDDRSNLRAEFTGACADPAGGQNFSADPLFCDPSGEEFLLDANSPCVGRASDGGDIGWAGAGCPRSMPLAVRETTWGAIKAGYRDVDR
jgi:hypothetical protein